MLELPGIMAQPVEPTSFSPEALADDSLFDDEEPMTRPGTPAPRRTRLRAAKDPDAEAREIAAKVVEKVAVARSLARIASSVLRSYADQKLNEIVARDAGNALAHVERARQVAAAAKQAAMHAATLAAARATARAEDDAS